MHKVVEYLLQKETITGGEMVAIIEGRDPALVEDAYASTHAKAKPLPGDIEPPAKNIHMVSEEIKPPLPPQEDEGSDAKPEDQASDDSDKPQSPAQPEEGNDSDSEETKE